MPVGIQISNAFRQLGESADILPGKYINYIGLIFTNEEVKSKSPPPMITFQKNPTISFYFKLEDIDGIRFSCSIAFSQTVPNTHYQITLYHTNSLGEMKMNDTINLTEITKGITSKFKKQFCLTNEDDSNIYILLKIKEVKPSEEIDIPKNQMSVKFLSLYEEKKLTDFKIICKDQEFCVHKLILVCQSDVFQAMFENPMIESRENVLVISDFEPKIVEVMIRYLYSDEMTESLSEDEFKQLLLIANKYNLEKLEKICFSEILKVIKTFEQAVDLAILTDSHNFVDMKKLVIQFIRENKNIMM
ncbi:speckle-type POZ protein-like [Leptopilina heterotoma]|uniref:speckle-type POZ protein-like n=1 Tax=Leptopilina heterotoma TaxID=63436 RepID=UPI001CA81D99|nr:speckle-type POZ protein-like [Leptopilina heterotoma]